MGRLRNENPAKVKYLRLNPRILALLMTVLSLAVVNWGLQYKMSLYQINGHTHTTAAKLWTGSKDNAQATRTAVPFAKQQPVALQLAFLIICLSLLAALQNNSELLTFFRCRQIVGTWKLQLIKFHSASFLRPPPVNA